MPHNKPVVIGEVVEAASTRFVVNCHQLDEPPSLGSLVIAHHGAIDVYAIVSAARTTSIDPGRQVMSLGTAAADESELRNEHPELEQLLRTDCDCQTVGYRQGERLLQRLPARPPRIHTFVREATSPELRAFFQELAFLPALLALETPGQDEALAAALRLGSEALVERDAFLVRAGKELARLLATDAQRLERLLALLRS